MSPVEPRPVVMGTMGLPSTVGVDALGFLPKMLAALSLAGAEQATAGGPKRS